MPTLKTRDNIRVDSFVTRVVVPKVKMNKVARRMIVCNESNDA